MKYFWLIVPLLLTGCASFKWVTVDKKGQVINENRQSLTILGNPVMACYNWKNELVAEGYFVQQNDDGSFLVDEYGKRYVTVKTPNCRLGPND
jgi:hypothetical protein